jgi:predicted RecB family nuclease
MLHIQAEAPLLRGKTVDDSNAIKQYLTKVARHCKELQSQQRLEQLKATVRNTMGLTGQYEFEGAEIKRIAELAHQMQTTLQSCTALEPKFRQRLQTRLEKFTAELSPGMDNIDLFWGLLGEARVLVARIGDESRHFVGWLTEMSEIMGQVQSRSEGLPAIRESHRFDLMRLGGRAA